MQRFRRGADTRDMLNPNLPRFAHLCVASLLSGCFSPLLPPLEGDGSTSTDESSGSTSPATETGSLDESSTTGGPQICGNGILDPGEVCDDGINDGSYGGCSEDCSALAAHCGDGVLQRAAGEACDDGDELDGNGCNPDCVVSGTVRWSDIVDGTENGLPDRGEAVAVSLDGSIFVTGTADSSAATLSKLWLRRYASDGTSVWTEIRDEAEDLYAADLQFLDEGALVVGALTDTLGDRFPRFLAYSLDGVPDWGYTHTEPRARVSLAAVSGGFIALATDTSQSAWLRSFELDGMPVWTVEPPLMLNESDVASFPDGGFVIAGTFGGSDVWVRRFTAEGDELWTQMLDGYGAVGGIAVTDEQIVVAGYGPDYWVQSLDTDGGLEWSDSRSEPDGWFFAFDIATSAGGDVFVVGQRKQADDPDLGRLYVARYSSTGALMWERAHASPFLAAGSAAGSGIVVDGVGDVIVVGTASSDTDSDFWILKLAP